MIHESLKNIRYDGDQNAQLMIAAGVTISTTISLNATEILISCVRNMATFLLYGLEVA